MNCMSGVQAARTLVVISPFRLRYLGLSSSGTCTLIWVPSIAPKHPLNHFHLSSVEVSNIGSGFLNKPFSNRITAFNTLLKCLLIVSPDR
ncbi:hypothetical protein HanRHA438_Chr13g0599381 [Helianthus annuus]|nr:hypothetical protein HanRHA438_Chr13g0599381 [Helianthus annuus]